ncbi:zinc-ribbon domain-containing protein [Chitinophaga niabensis]|uniref:zinc-ribbon domain-containing protein n=1 Tax=Chitinophaga niabensis TaxID=536979 RepID=UPI0031B9DD91
MLPIILGTKQIPIDTENLLLNCPSCNSHQFSDILVSSQYFHLYYLPVIPIDKDAYSICNKCGYQRSFEFSRKFVQENSIQAKKFRHPAFTYSGILIIIVMIIFIIIAN